MKPHLLASAGLVCVGEVLHIVGLATPNWLVAKNGDGHMGLFQICGDDGTCIDWPKTPSELKATIAMTILGMVCGVMAAALTGFFLLSILMNKPPPVLVAFGGFLACIMACIFIAIGVIVYAVKIYSDDFDSSSVLKFGYSFALCIVGAVLMPIGGALVYFTGRSMVS